MSWENKRCRDSAGAPEAGSAVQQSGGARRCVRSANLGAILLILLAQTKLKIGTLEVLMFALHLFELFAELRPAAHFGADVVSGGRKGARGGGAGGRAQTMGRVSQAGAWQDAGAGYLSILSLHNIHARLEVGRPGHAPRDVFVFFGSYLSRGRNLFFFPATNRVPLRIRHTATCCRSSSATPCWVRESDVV